ncbi:DUF4411 family protein [Microbulbifer hainanensis]|uniref:DUF4411 family protein n=1 Tax=Microbulbifer hainanensis TaxID=2735675 RepID=UPI001866A160|nr:DUF4411 family protein [Microbulbifer hainanensis]
MNYLLDANTYIEAKNRYYGMDICPAYWEWLDKKFDEGFVASIEFVGRELKAGNDELVDWVKHRPQHFIKYDDSATQEAFVEIANYVVSGDYNSGNRDNFLAGADPWIIAKAKTLGASVVTHEAVLSPATKKVKVPNICKYFDVSCVDTFSFMRQLQAKFVLGA